MTLDIARSATLHGFEPPHEVVPPQRPISEIASERTEEISTLLEKFNQKHVHTVENFKLQSGTVLKEARVGFTIYSSDDGRLSYLSRFEQPEIDLNKPIILVFPALTGDAALFKLEGMERSQGPGWAKYWANPSMLSHHSGSKNDFLDLDRFTVICVDHFGGNGTNSTTSAAELGALADEVRFSDGVRLVEEALYERGVRNLHAVIGGSIGGGQAIECLMLDKINIERIFNISGSAARNERASEFFAITRDIVSPGFDGTLLADRLEKNLVHLVVRERSRVDAQVIETERGLITPYELLVGDVLDELRSLSPESSELRRSECARRVGFLLFVPPEFYDGKLERSGGVEKLRRWFAEEGENFAARFDPSALRCLSNMVVNASIHDAQVVADRLREKGTQLVSYYVFGDTLFPGEEQEAFCVTLRSLLGPEDSNRLVAQIAVEDSENGHDDFLTRRFVQLGVKRLRQYL